MTKQPSYRFAGYTEPWEEKKLGDFSDVTKLAGFEFTNHVKYSSTGSIIALRGLNIKNGNIILNDVKYIDESDFSKLHRSKLIINDIMFTYVGTVGELAIIEDNNKFYLAPNVSRIRILNDTYPYFLMQYMWRKSFYQSVIFPLIATSSQPALSMENIRKFNISLPSLPEQTAIGSFFQDIDQLISLQQRKLEVLKEQKKTYLKLLFPVKGQTKPGLRFAGFEDDWKEVKLGEVGEIQTGNTPPTNEEDNYEKNGFPWVTPTDINSLVLHTTSKQLSDVGKSKARIAKSGSILVTCIASIGKNTLVRTDSAFNQQINSLTPSEKYSSYFLLTQSEIWSRYMLSVAGAGTMQIINKSDFSNIKAMVPTLLEQEAIGSFFQDLDKAIAKQEEKVNQLKESKQTLLRKMFI